MSASSAGSAGRSARPTVESRSWPLGTRLSTFTAGLAAWRRSKYPPALLHSIGTSSL